MINVYPWEVCFFFFFLILFLKGNIGGVDLGEGWQEEKLGGVVGGKTIIDIQCIREE